MPIINPDGGKSGGGTTAGAAIVRGPFTFAYNTANINTGVVFYTPTVGDVLLNAWIEVTAAFNGTTPLADIGLFATAGDAGWFGNAFLGAVSVANADVDALDPSGGPAILSQASATTTASDVTDAGIQVVGHFGGVAWSSLQRILPGRFVSASPLKVVVSQDGTRGGAAVGGSAGAGRVYLVTATPTV